MINEERFLEAKKRAELVIENKSNIGTLGEKILHRTLKLYYEPRRELHEAAHLGIVADIKNEEGITEIQTGSFAPLLPKLKRLLPTERVTVVCPIIKEKRLFWVDPETGETAEPKRSPKKGKFSDALPELSKLSGLLFSDNLTVRLLLLSADEYKLLDGYGKDKKKKSTKIERVPTSLIEEYDIKSLKDLKGILPILPTPFSAKDFNKATSLKRRKAFFSLKFLENSGVIERCGKSGNAYLYKLI